MIKKNDLILMSAALFVVLIWFLINNCINKTGAYVTVSYKGIEIDKKSLSEDGEYTVPCVEGEAFGYKIENGKVYGVNSNCRDKICIHQGMINKTGQTIICLPQQITLSVNGESGEYDAVID